MMICPKCHGLMKHVYRFSPERTCELDICCNCYFETKPKRFDGAKIMQDNNEIIYKKKRKKTKKEKRS